MKQATQYFVTNATILARAMLRLNKHLRGSDVRSFILTNYGKKRYGN